MSGKLSHFDGTWWFIGERKESFHSAYLELVASTSTLPKEVCNHEFWVLKQLFTSSYRACSKCGEELGDTP